KYENGRWISGTGVMKDVRRVLYNLPEVVNPKNDIIASFEGEQDAKNFQAKTGIISTCCIGGANKWRSEYNQSLKDKILLLFFDDDKAGARDVFYRIINLLPVAKKVYLITLPNEHQQSGYDVSDYMKDHSLEELFDVINKGTATHLN